jgi:hypothetical protein
MMHLRGNAGLGVGLGSVSLAFLVALGASALPGCSSEPLDNGSAEQAGSLGFNLEAAPGD